MLAEFLGEGLYFFRLLADTAIHRAGETDYNLPNLMLINDIGNCFYIQPLFSTVNNSKRAG